MNQNQSTTPPPAIPNHTHPGTPTPPAASPKVSYGTKIILMGLISFVLMLGALMVLFMIESRESNEQKVASEIAASWGHRLHMAGPLALEHPDSALTVRPASFDCNIKVETTTLHRNIYEAEVFSAEVTASGLFRLSELKPLGNTAMISITLNTHGITKLGKLTVNGVEYDWTKSSNRLTAEIPLEGLPDKVKFATTFNYHGTDEILVDNVGEISKVTIDGKASNPSFSGSRLPVERKTDKNDFTACWETDESGVVLSKDYVSENSCVKFLVGVDHYQKVSRSLKYAFIIIVLTFIAVLFTEILLHRTIPLLNYFLIGVALILFYSLLLAFTEFISFGYSYLIAAAMTVTLIAGYIRTMIGSCKVGAIIGLILSLMYLCCYIMLNATDFALLFGSLLLFFALAAMMYGSLKIRH